MSKHSTGKKSPRGGIRRRENGERSAQMEEKINKGKSGGERCALSVGEEEGNMEKRRGKKRGKVSIKGWKTF